MYQHSVKIFLLCLIAVLVSSSEVAVRKPRSAPMVHTQMIDIHKAPYSVQLRDSAGKLFCAGTLVSWQHVITAAHCFPDGKFDGITVVAGATTTLEAGVSRSVEKLTIHPRYSKDGQFLTNDIAVLKLSESLPSDTKNIKFVPLSAEPLKEKDVLQAFGWTHYSDEDGSWQHLRTIRLPVVPHESCEFEVGKSSSMMCIENKGVDKCKPFSGGPALYRSQLVGILSRVDDCTHESPFVFVNIPAVRDFILDEIKA